MLAIIELARLQKAVAAEALMTQRTLDQGMPLLESWDLAGFVDRVFTEGSMMAPLNHYLGQPAANMGLSLCANAYVS